MILTGKVKLSGLAATVLYIGYSALISFLFFILAGKYHVSPFTKPYMSDLVIGSIGYISSWWFVRKIYSSIKID